MSAAPFTFLDTLLEAPHDLPSDSILSRSIYKDARLQATLFHFAPGQQLNEHTASHPAVLHFLQGEAALVLGGEQRHARPGTWVHMNPHLPHSIHAETPLTMLLLLLMDA
jgi:quercetin dioxygenase-like cupin family protein